MSKRFNKALANPSLPDEPQTMMSPELEQLSDRIAILLTEQILIDETSNFDRKEDRVDN